MRKLGNAEIAYVPNGSDYEKFARPPIRGAVPGFEKEPGEVIIGTVAPENRPFIAPKGNDSAFRALLAELIAKPEARREIGEQYQLRVREKYSREEMFRADETVFEARYA